jgi:hypothetical protein
VEDRNVVWGMGSEWILVVLGEECEVDTFD